VILNMPHMKYVCTSMTWQNIGGTFPIASPNQIIGGTCPLVPRGFGAYGQNEPSLTELMNDADERLFRRIMYNREHVLQPFLPDGLVLSHNLRRRTHCNKSLITKTADLSNNDYIIRATYKGNHWHYS